jgi:UDP-N-acetylmuramoyl-L-alanyl-D-glutamate--2,6-diaminopimelate ligase
MELVARRANGAGIFVDYAHTPDAVTAAVTAIKPHTAGRIIVIVGAGGDRDPGKRAPMGTAAAQADFIIVTDDNPRNENPSDIRRQVWAGLREAAQRAQEIGDRAEAILTGVDSLEAGDVLLITGKGHETGQIIGQEIVPFDDAEQARAAVAALDGLQT